MIMLKPMKTVNKCERDEDNEENTYFGLHT